MNFIYIYIYIYKPNGIEDTQENPARNNEIIVTKEVDLSPNKIPIKTNKIGNCHSPQKIKNLNRETIKRVIRNPVIYGKRTISIPLVLYASENSHLSDLQENKAKITKAENTNRNEKYGLVPGLNLESVSYLSRLKIDQPNNY